MSSGHGSRSQHRARARGLQNGFVEEIEAEGLSRRQDRGERYSHGQVRVELTAGNLARLDDQPRVRGPLQQLENASKQVMGEFHVVLREIDHLDSSLQSWKQQAESLKNQIALLQAAASEATAVVSRLDDARMSKLSELLEEQDIVAGRIQQEEEAKESLLEKLNGGERAVDHKLCRLGLMAPGGGSASSPNLPRYPARADVTDNSEAVPEEERPWIFGG
ncbi:hypothetical protein F5883DRAFT_623607 [Diaporthe sp. PMI_573]|nr:hypothetical protein F5883DRAFT_623607 [Diaporthaceae sp. PMI_573]